MKKLQESTEEVCRVTGLFPLQIIERRVADPKSIILMLHGLNERGKRIMRRLLPHMPADAHLIAPNGPFPLPRLKSDRLDFGYAWYFFDKFTREYHIDQAFAVSLLTDFLKNKNPDGLPVTIIGFSQGGYLAPFVAYRNSEVKKVIGIGCEFRQHFFQRPPQFSLYGVHGDADKIIPYQDAEKEIHALKAQGISVDWHLIANAGHEINTDIAIKVKELL